MRNRWICVTVLVVSSAAALSGCKTSPETTGPGQPQISGEPQRVAVVNKRYEFVPSVSGWETGALTFAIQNMPGWAEFDPNTGLLTGSPTFADSGDHDGIVISVTDGNMHSSLPAFSIAVSRDGRGAITLSWLPPEQNINGSYIVDLAGYRIRYGMESGRLDRTIEINNVGLTTYVIDDLRPGTYFIAATAFNQSNLESDFSDEVIKSVVIY